MGLLCPSDSVSDDAMDMGAPRKAEAQGVSAGEALRNHGSQCPFIRRNDSWKSASGSAAIKIRLQAFNRRRWRESGTQARRP
jgi:hypothetical protein